MTADTTFSNALHTLGFIEAITRFGDGCVQKEKSMSLEDYVGKITAIFSPYISTAISEKEFSSAQIKVKEVLSEFIKTKERNLALFTTYD